MLVTLLALMGTIIARRAIPLIFLTLLQDVARLLHFRNLSPRDLHINFKTNTHRIYMKILHHYVHRN